MRKKFMAILLIMAFLIFNMTAFALIDSDNSSTNSSTDRYEYDNGSDGEKIQIGQYDADIVIGDKKTYPKNFVTYKINPYGVKIQPKYIEGVFYENKPAEPEIYIYDEKTERLLKKGTDYSIEYIDNDKTGTAYIIIEGMGDYEGSIVYPFKINKQADGVQTTNNNYYADEDEETTVIKGNRKKTNFTPFPEIIQTTLPATPKPSYPPAVPIKSTPKPTPSPTPSPTATPKPTPMPSRIPYVNIFDHKRFMWEYTSGEFGLNMYVSKAELTVIFSGILMDEYDPSKEYTVTYEDVTEDSPFRNYIGFMSQYNIIEGKSAAEFEPNKMITRADFAVILSKFIEDEGYSAFIDVPRDYWAKKYIDKVAAKGWMTGTSDGLFRPDKYITRGEIAKILVTMLDRDIDATLKIVNLPQFADVSSDNPLYPYVMAATTYR